MGLGAFYFRFLDFNLLYEFLIIIYSNVTAESAAS